MKSEKWAQDLMREFGSLTNDEDLKNGYKKVCEPNFGDVVYYKNNEGAFQKIKIVNGQYFDSKHGRLSNFWYWTNINDDSSESKEEHSGYGNFFVIANQ